MEVPAAGEPNRILSKRERRAREKGEKRIQEEEEIMHEEQEKQFSPFNLTGEQKRLRSIIRQRAPDLQVRMEREAEYQNLREKGETQWQTDGKENEVEAHYPLPIKAPRGVKPTRILSEDERQVWEKWEQRVQEEEEVLREEKEKQVSRSNLTEEQKRIRQIIRTRALQHRKRMEREATDEKYRQKRVAQRQSRKKTEKPAIENSLVGGHAETNKHSEIKASMKIGFIIN